jgi:RNA polymerase sigma factor (sigma-70 family)
MTASVSDHDLWARGAAGHASAFGELFERHSDAIYNYLFRRTADWAAAEDLTSVVFLEAWRRCKEVRLESESALPWLYGVATNVLRNERRSRRRHSAALARLSGERDHADFIESSVERIDDECAMAQALALVARLPKSQQDVFALCVWSELSYDAAALALGIPSGTVRSRLSRTRARLAELIVASGHEDSKSTAKPKVV